MSEPVSVDCAQVDINALCDKMRVAAFDLDGTLARSKKPMHPDMAQALSTLTTLMPVAIISGGAMPLLESQVTDVLTDDADRTHLHLMPTTGTRYFRWSGGEWTPIYQRDLDSEDRRAAIASLEHHARAMGLWEEHTWGDRI